jgi:hypothetical protein
MNRGVPPSLVVSGKASIIKTLLIQHLKNELEEGRDEKEAPRYMQKSQRKNKSHMESRRGHLS